MTLDRSQAEEPLSRSKRLPLCSPSKAVPSLKGLSLSCPCFQALDHKVRTLTGDLSLREDSIAKLQKEKRALEELHQVGTTGFYLAQRVELGDWRPWFCCPSAGAYREVSLPKSQFPHQRSGHCHVLLFSSQVCCKWGDHTIYHPD